MLDPSGFFENLLSSLKLIIGLLFNKIMTKILCQSFFRQMDLDTPTHPLTKILVFAHAVTGIARAQIYIVNKDRDVECYPR